MEQEEHGVGVDADDGLGGLGLHSDTIHVQDAIVMGAYPRDLSSQAHRD